MNEQNCILTRLYKKDQKDKHGTPFSQHNASVDPIEH